MRQDAGDQRHSPNSAKTFGNAQCGFGFDQNPFSLGAVVLNDADAVRAACALAVPHQDLLREIALLRGELENISSVTPQQKLNDGVAQAAQAIVKYDGMVFRVVLREIVGLFHPPV